MSKHDEARRAFLVGAVVGAGAVASTTLVPEAHAKTRNKHDAAPTPTTAYSNMSGGHGAFLNVKSRPIATPAKAEASH